jgi:hypothetical protein
MAGLVPAIHVFVVTASKTWMPGTRPGMTCERSCAESFLARHCERSEAIQSRLRKKLDCFVASAPRNDEAMRSNRAHPNE